MSPFTRRTIGAADTLGERLRRLRLDAGWSLDDVTRRIGVPARHLGAIEEGRYADLPGQVYARSFVKRYATLLEVRAETATELFDREWEVAVKANPMPASTPPSKPIRTRAIVTPYGIRRAVAVVLGLAVLVYLGTEIRHLTAAPSLTVASPVDELTTADRSVELSGQTEPETTVTANGRLILVDRNGQFREVLDLQDGLNTIVIRAQRKRGSATTVVRRILVPADH